MDEWRGTEATDLNKLYALPQRTYRANRHGSMLRENQRKRESERPVITSITSPCISTSINQSKFPLIQAPSSKPPPSTSSRGERLKPPPVSHTGGGDRLKPPPNTSSIGERLKPPPVSHTGGGDRLKPPSNTSSIGDRLKPPPEVKPNLSSCTETDGSKTGAVVIQITTRNQSLNGTSATPFITNNGTHVSAKVDRDSTEECTSPSTNKKFKLSTISWP